MTQSEVQWERMFPDEFESAFETGLVVYLPYGLRKPYVWHNAVGMDAIRAHQRSCLGAQQHGGIVAPPFYWIVMRSVDKAPGDMNVLINKDPRSKTYMHVFEKYYVITFGC